MKFATLISFTDQGIRDIAETTDRAISFTEQAEAAGLVISELLWLTGRFDGLMVFDATDHETASAAMLHLAKSGNVKTETLPAFDSAAMQRVIEKVQ